MLSFFLLDKLYLYKPLTDGEKKQILYNKYYILKEAETFEGKCRIFIYFVCMYVYVQVDFTEIKQVF